MNVDLLIDRSNQHALYRRTKRNIVVISLEMTHQSHARADILCNEIVILVTLRSEEGERFFVSIYR